MSNMAGASLFMHVALMQAETEEQRRHVIQKQLERIFNDKERQITPDFASDLEWFNTSGPLSFRSNLKGKIVVLDFFTYCCINCMHILPDLEALEQKYSTEDAVVVVGVHSAKFENEKMSANILNAVLRYNIHHPVINDHDALMWNALQITCWPTLLIIGPSGEPILPIIGEGHRDILFEVVQTCVDFYKPKGLLEYHSLPITNVRESLPDSPLLYPGKICPSPSGDHFVISDTGHNRILIVTAEGVVQHCIGGTDRGYQDGLYHEARFHAPQGVCWIDDVIYVADTDNHAIRKIDIKEERVSTIAGTGIQGNDCYGGGQGTNQIISSPWDVVVGPPNEDVLFIAMAGTHQVWGLYLSDGEWLKSVKHSQGTCMNYAGSGKEENRNNSYPRKAAFAQPSGIALAPNEPYQCMFVADSESSTIRSIAFKDGAVKNVVGGERDPMNLFAFGDDSGTGLDAKLQHPLGVAWDHSKLLFVADSYNHKVKMVDPAERYCATYAGTGQPGNVDGDDILQAQFNEPGGLCVSPCGSKLYVADTNNHAIRYIDLMKGSVKELKIIMPAMTVDSSNAPVSKVKSMLPKSIPLQSVDCVTIETNGKVVVSLDVSLPNGNHLTDGAPTAWQIFVPGDKFQRVMAKTKLSSLQEPHPSFEWTLPTTLTSQGIILQVEASIYYCLPTGVCQMQSLGFQVPVRIDAEGSKTAEVVLSYKVE